MADIDSGDLKILFFTLWILSVDFLLLPWLLVLTAAYFE